MRTIRIKLYKFNELSENAKQKAIQYFRYSKLDINDAWENIKEDAAKIELSIISLDDNRLNKGEFYNSAEDTAKLILMAYGKDCDTYNSAENFLYEWNIKKEKFENENPGFYFIYQDESEDLCNEFLQSILEDYRIMYNKEIEYQDSDEYIIETIEANEYEFTKDGKLN